jgi:hypothetical protein
MKRLVWLLLAVFCTAIAQVQPVEPLVSSQVRCPCCEIPGACGMADCNVPPSSVPVRLIAEQSAPITVSAARRNAARLGRIALTLASSFDAQSATLAVRNDAAISVRAGRGPLFQAHCSFLI